MKRNKPINKCVTIGHESRMKCFKALFFALLVSIAIIFSSGCTSNTTKIALKNTNPRKRIAAVRKLTNPTPTLLAMVAVEDPDSDVRENAVKKLTDQSFLAKIAVENKFTDVRVAAVRKLTEQSLLAKIAVEDKYVYVRVAAVEKLTDQSLLAKIAIEDKDSDVREAALKRLDALRNNW